ncbi:TolC family protein [Flavobacterium antarcticum]|uniref:TolC family protein n=1 Tax=Flavobacterium antarcticum TaxID=271155 RepID=UPI0003B4D88A|nr:TolC family protein [Flavobacterium antarcticum]
MKNKIILLSIFLISLISNAQRTLTLGECYNLVEKNYPLAKQVGLLEQRSSSEIEAINKGKLPKVDLNAQATYQSEVIGLPMALPGIEQANKDQYRATLDVNQLIYNGGIIEANAKLKQAQTKTQQQQVTLNLYGLQNRINHYFFSILLLQQKKELLLSKDDLLFSKIKEVKVGVKYGALLPTSELVLEAERFKIKQQLTEIKFENNKMLENLSQLTNSIIDDKTVLLTPPFLLNTGNRLRPELAFYDLQNEQIESSKNVLAKSNLPKVFAFGQAGYGNPGLNMLDNSFHSFYIVGLKTSWNVFDWGKMNKDKQTLDIAQEIVQTEKETFELNNKIELQQLDNEIKKIQQLLESDIEIIQIYEKIVKSSDAQMKNGVITTSEYLTDVIRLFEAKNSLAQHQVGLSLAQHNYQTILGN